MLEGHDMTGISPMGDSQVRHRTFVHFCPFCIECCHFDRMDGMLAKSGALATFETRPGGTSDTVSPLAPFYPISLRKRIGSCAVPARRITRALNRVVATCGGACIERRLHHPKPRVHNLRQQAVDSTYPDILKLCLKIDTG